MVEAVALLQSSIAQKNVVDTEANVENVDNDQQQQVDGDGGEQSSTTNATTTTTTTTTTQSENVKSSNVNDDATKFVVDWVHEIKLCSKLLHLDQRNCTRCVLRSPLSFSHHQYRLFVCF
jgi:hypothetical protein